MTVTTGGPVLASTALRAVPISENAVLIDDLPFTIYHLARCCAHRLSRMGHRHESQRGVCTLRTAGAGLRRGRAGTAMTKGGVVVVILAVAVLASGAYSFGRLVPTNSLTTPSALPISVIPDEKPIADKLWIIGKDRHHAISICDPFVVGCLLFAAFSSGFSLGAGYAFRQQDRLSGRKDNEARKI